MPNLARVERLALCDTAAELGPMAPTLCSPWTARDLLAHLVLREQRPDLATGLVVSALASRLDRATLAYAARVDFDALVAEVRSGPPIWHPTKVDAVDDAVNLAEMVIHHEDLLRGDGTVGPRREVSAALGKAVGGWLATMAPLAFRRSPVGVELQAPGRRPVTIAKDQVRVRVAGEPVELLLLAFGRARAAELTFTGADADVAALRAAPLGL